MTENNNNINRMLELIDYGRKKTDTNNSTQGIVEYHAKAANGKTYGIIKEGQNFYIKVAPKKDTEILAEDYDYINGYMNKKENEYKTYSAASKNFDLVLMSINESCGNKQPIKEQYSGIQASEWQDKETKELRKEINRYKQISENVNKILDKKDNYITENTFPNHDLPEAPAKHNDPKTANGNPYDQKANPEEYKEFSKTNSNPKNAGTPYDKKVNVTNSDMQQETKKTGKGTEVYSEKPKYAPDGAITSKPSKSTGKVIKLKESQVLAWRHENDDYIDTSSSTNIGSSAPYTDNVDCSISNQCAKNQPKRNCNCQGDNNVEEYEIEVSVNEDVDPNNVMGMPDEYDPENDLFGDGDNFASQNFEGNALSNINAIRASRDSEFDDSTEDGDENEDIESILQKYDDGTGDFGENEEEEDEVGDELPVDDEDDLENGDELPVDSSDSTETFDTSDSIDNSESNLPIDDEDDLENEDGVFESKMNNWGKHPGYGKQPFTTPKNTEVSKNGRKWDDKSVENDKPFGKSKGDSKPFGKKTKQPVEENSLNVFGKHPGYRKQPMTLPPNTEVGVNSREWHDSSVKGSKPFGQSKGRKTAFTDETSNQPVDESTLNVFGKHPGYRKKPFTTPKNSEVGNGRDWNDSSVNNEQPFGQSKGNSEPYSEKLVNMITDSVMSRIQKKS